MSPTAPLAALFILSGSAAADISGTYTASSVQLTLAEAADRTVKGTLVIGERTLPLAGTVADDVASGSIRDGDSSFPFTARALGSDVELSSGDVKVRLVRSKAANPLNAIPIEAREPDKVAATDEADPSPDTAAQLPSTFTHPLGFSMRHPAAWRARTTDGVTALIPDDARQLAGGPGEAYALAAMLAPAGIDLAERMQTEMSATFPGMTQTADPERRAGTVTLRYKSDAGDLAATVRAVVKGELLIVMIGIGTSEALSRRDSLAAAAFRSVALTARDLDQSIVGSWTHSSSYSSAGFTMASSKTYTLSADGTYTFTSQMAGGTADVGTDTGPSRDRGIWAAKDGTLTLVDAEGNAVTRTYRIVDGHLLTFDGAGKRTIWSR